jgi:hypothetical protein
MPDALLVIGQSLKTWFRHIVLLTAAGLVWIGLSMTVILLPFATAGLYVLTNRIVYHRPLRAAELIAGARCYWRAGIEWMVSNGLVLGFLYGVLIFESVAGPLPTLFQLAAAAGGVGWFSLQLYVWPFLLEQPQKTFGAAVLNSLLLHLSAPIYMLGLMMAASSVIVTAFFFPLPIGVWAMSYLAVLGNQAVVERLSAYGLPPDPEHAVCVN